MGRPVNFPTAFSASKKRPCNEITPLPRKGPAVIAAAASKPGDAVEVESNCAWLRAKLIAVVESGHKVEFEDGSRPVVDAQDVSARIRIVGRRASTSSTETASHRGSG